MRLHRPAPRLGTNPVARPHPIRPAPRRRPAASPRAAPDPGQPAWLGAAEAATRTTWFRVYLQAGERACRALCIRCVQRLGAAWPSRVARPAPTAPQRLLPTPPPPPTNPTHPPQGAVALTVAAAVDAAFSGDWSRVGAISKDAEDALKPLVGVLAAVHAAAAGVAGTAAARKGNPVAPAVAKAAVVGVLAAVEAVFAEDRGA